MTFSLDAFYRTSGTRFRLFPQSSVLPGFEEPVVVWVSSPLGSLGPGPSDERMYALDPSAKEPYGEADLPPYAGPCHLPVEPDSRGHFDHVGPDDPGFKCVHMFGTVRRVLDVWETYLGGPVPWHFSMTHPRLELIPHVPWDNAQFGWGFMECGEGKDDEDVLRPFALNFDVLAHETGHGIVFSLTGIPSAETLTTAYRGFHESASDCVAMISVLHFDMFVDHLLETTSGDLYVENELNRIGELSRTRQIRNASNALKLKDVISFDTPPGEATGKQVHDLGQPLTGAVFDICVELFQDRLVEFGLLTADHAASVRQAATDECLEDMSHDACVEAFARDPAGFKRALCDARDMVGLRLAQTWHRLRPRGFSYDGVARAFLDVDLEMTGDRRHQQDILECFQWRGIGLDIE